MLQADLFTNAVKHPSIQKLIDDGFLFVINHSAGKDSQAMTIKLKEIVPADQLLVVHAHLGEIEWDGVKEHIRKTIGNLPLVIAHPVWKDGSKKTFFDMVRDRHQKHEAKRAEGQEVNASPWPSPTMRQCTSDLKSGPINREIRRFLKDNPQYNDKVVNCIGIRADESANRAKKSPFTLDKKNCTKTRVWYEWFPIFDMSEKEVFQTIKDANEVPHWAYGAGMSRLSCVICIMSSKKDLQTGARLNPKVYAMLVELEKETGKTMMMPVQGKARTLEEITGIIVQAPAFEEEITPIYPINVQSGQGVLNRNIQGMLI